MAINRLRVRDTMVNRGIATEAPAMEFADVLDDELDSALDGFATKNDLLSMEERLKRYTAEQTNKVVAVTLGGIAVGAAIGVAIISIIITVT